VCGLPDLQEEPTAALAGHLVDQHGIGEHDLDHTEHPHLQLGHTHPSTW
jgi:hypothetical protein